MRSASSWTPADTAPRPGGGEPVERALHDRLPVVLGQRRKEMEHQPPARGRGVDALLEHHEIDTLLTEPTHQVEQMLLRAADPLQSGDHDLVARTQLREHRIELGPRRELPARRVDVDLFLRHSRPQ